MENDVRTPDGRERWEIHVTGIVQGVGYRPFVYGLARSLSLGGWVLNDSEGVHIQVEGAARALQAFYDSLTGSPPPLAVVDHVHRNRCPVQGDGEFRIIASRSTADRRALISPDVATCPECLAEIFDPGNRRYRYPFTNCTNCGPRFTIVRGVPYDRAATTMAAFAMCPQCRLEYETPADRRFHAQPNACPNCGPAVQLVDRQGVPVPCEGGDAIAACARLIAAGAIVAVKGLGGYHLACSPFDPAAVAQLRRRKRRSDKPFAIMAATVAQVEELCRVSPEERVLLESRARPIVLLTRRGAGAIAADVAPRQKTLGVMLAYTPLHYILLSDSGAPLVMTSGNRTDEPIAYRDDEALRQLGDLADYFLAHNRPIHIRCDDSVARVAAGGAAFVRRSRGFAPRPISAGAAFVKPILACGADLKNAFCLAKDKQAFVSHYIGDLDNAAIMTSYRESVDHYCRLFDIAPEAVACDMHPDYLSTRYARERQTAGAPLIAVQHHHAHIASCLADNERPAAERAIGVALDGTGYGVDGAIWGGEFFEGSVAAGFVRRAHFEYAPLPGGDAAVQQPWRNALGRLIALYGAVETARLPLAPVRTAGEVGLRNIARMIERGINCPQTSSAGRLFDAAAALLGLPGAVRATYEGQAAVELEQIASFSDRGYPIALDEAGDGWLLRVGDLFRGAADDILGGVATGEIASRFHRAIADAVVGACRAIRDAGGPSLVALSGGVFQNALLLEQVSAGLAEQRFVVCRHSRAPANDGGISLGQAWLANQILQRG